MLNFKTKQDENVCFIHTFGIYINVYSIEMIHTLNDVYVEPSDDLKFASSVSLFGIHLKKPQYLNSSNLKEVVTLATNSIGDDKEGYRTEFIRLVRTIN